MWIVAVGLGGMCVLVGVLVSEVFKPSDPLDEVVGQVVVRMLVPDGVVLVFGPTRLPSSHKSSSARPSSCRRTKPWGGSNPSHDPAMECRWFLVAPHSTTVDRVGWLESAAAPCRDMDALAPR